MVFTAFFVAVAVPLVRFLTLFFCFFVFFFRSCALSFWNFTRSWCYVVNFPSRTSHALWGGFWGGLGGLITFSRVRFTWLRCLDARLWTFLLELHTLFGGGFGGFWGGLITFFRVRFTWLRCLDATLWTFLLELQFGCRYSEYWQGMAYTQSLATPKIEDIRKEKWPSQNESRFAFNDPAIHVASNNFAMFSRKNDVMPCRSSEEISWLSMTSSSTETNSLTALQNDKKTYFSPSNYEMKPL